jgi:hypothetical protein
MAFPFKTYDYTALSLSDLLAARDLYHLHLMNKKNVFATAIGYYRIRKVDDWPTSESPNPDTSKNKYIPRTLGNSEVRPYSWPAILVFVENWELEHDLVDTNNTDIVPKTLYLPDGKAVPICVIEASKVAEQNDEVNIDSLNFPTNVISGGFPLLTEVQNQIRTASFGCLVTDGHTVYGLTNRHVAGKEGTPISTILNKTKTIIGYSSDLQIGKVRFEDMYPTLTGKSVFLNVDIGLVEINDLSQWKTEVLGIGQFDEIIDLDTNNITLKLINQKVTGFGAISNKKIEGEIQALFYRYKSIGGFEYVCDFLIGPRTKGIKSEAGDENKTLTVQYGDSGTLLLIEIDKENTDLALEEKNNKHQNTTALHPFGVLWGMHQFTSGNGNGNGNGKDKQPFILASCLSTVCNLLDVELVRGWNSDLVNTWGKVGHYTVGNTAVEMLDNNEFSKFMKLNVANISFSSSKITKDLDRKSNADLPSDPDTGFCPLADVPDIIWKQTKASLDGKFGFKWGRQGDENPNHYADADAKGKDGKTLYDYCDTLDKMKVDVWRQYYDDVDEVNGIDTTTNEYKRSKEKRGIVCFRVWQIFNYMVSAANEGDASKFIFGAGVLAHYVGDACQPLHSSYMSDGDPADDKTIDYTAKVTSKKKDGSISHTAGDVYKKKTNAGSGVHVAYEDKMIDDYIDQIFPGIPGMIKEQEANSVEKITNIDSGQAAAFAVLNLMQKTQATISPKAIVEAFKTARASKNNVSDALFEQFGPQTIEVLSRGARYLAAVWEAAWNCANQNKIDSNTQVSTDVLKALYIDPNELPSKHLETIQSELN